MSEKVQAIVHFIDGTHLTLTWPQQAGSDATLIAMNVRKALDANKIVVEADGQLLVIPLQNVKYVGVSPAPASLPREVLQNAQIVG